MKTEIHYMNLVSVYAPLFDASQMIEGVKGSSGFMTELAEKLERAKAPLRESIEMIEAENPTQFS